MFSMPPAIAQSIVAEPDLVRGVAIACAPEPQTRLTVSAGTVDRQAGVDGGLASRVHLDAGLDRRCP